jgi:hypothetical protein
MPPRSRPATTKNNTAQPQPDNTKGYHETAGGSVSVDGKEIASGDDTCATGPPTGEHHRVTQPTLLPLPTPDTLTAHIQHLVTQAPPLTDTQRAELRAILQPRK